MLKKKFIVIEGLEGAGKSTAVKVIKDYLEQKGLTDIVQCREPGGTPLGEKIRQLVKSDSFTEKIDPKTELLLMYASRVQLVNNVIKPALSAGKVVICDRFYYSTFAYQGGGREIDLSLIKTIHDACLGHFKPDLTIYMDIDAVTGLKRATDRGGLDRFEKEKIVFFNKTRDLYLQQLRNCPEMKLVNASATLDNVATQLRNILSTIGV